ncbi:MAG TPA: monovalent cation/H+ antiporter subunit D family protein [Dongiaceae bacterium]|nr:monovalent cation/H+ antiporter subunit D family protein [Dongiaceae bacterium]
MITPHLPVLQVVLPLLAAPVCVLLRNGRLAWLLALVVGWGSLLIAVLLLVRVLDGPPLSYAIGGWAPPWGIEYRIARLNAFLLVIVAAIDAVVLVYARASVEREIDPDRVYLFYAAFLLCFTGLLGIAATGDAFNLFVFLEISSLSSYALIAMGRDRRALTAAYQYLIMGTIGATFILIGVGLAYMVTGTLNMADMADRLVGLTGNRTVRVAFAFLTVGLSLKLALFPLHLWLPNAYAYAPSVVSAFLTATATKVSVYALLRFTFSIFGADVAFEVLPLHLILPPLAILAMFVGSLVAIFQDDVKRMLAYSSIAQIGYIVLGISFASLNGLTAGIVHLFNHALTKGGLFLALGCVFYRLGSVRLGDMRGLGQRMPLAMAAFVVGGMGLIGIPLTAGFVSKWYLVVAALDSGWWPIAVLVLGSSLLALVYVWRVVEVVYFQPAPRERGEIREAPLSMVLPTWVLIGASVYFGIDTSVTVGVARAAAAFLLQGPLGAGP